MSLGCRGGQRGRAGPRNGGYWIWESKDGFKWSNCEARTSEPSQGTDRPADRVIEKHSQILNDKVTSDNLLTDTTCGHDAQPPTRGTHLLESPSQVDRGPCVTTRQAAHAWLMTTVHL